MWLGRLSHLIAQHGTLQDLSLCPPVLLEFSCPEDSLTFQKDICYISFAFYLCDLVKIEITIYPHLFSTFVHFTIALTYFLCSVGVWSPWHSSGSGLWLWTLCNFNCGLSTERRTCNEKRFIRQVATLVRRKRLFPAACPEGKLLVFHHLSHTCKCKVPVSKPSGLLWSFFFPWASPKVSRPPLRKAF